MSPSHWTSQSAVTEPGKLAAAALDRLPSDIASLHNISSQLVLHYMVCQSDVIPERRDEIHTLYADAMFACILSRSAPSTLERERGPGDRLVGCCRDATVLFLSMARHKKIPARGRVGFAAYLHQGWMADHVIAQVWDTMEQRWRLVDPEMPLTYTKTVESHTVDWLDLRPGIDFQTGAEAWAAVRGKTADADRYVVTPTLQEAALKSVPYIAHNVLHDLAFMNKQGVLLWDCWGPELEYMSGIVPESHLALLDEIAELLLNRDVSPKSVSEMMSRGSLSIPSLVTRFDPNDGPSLVPKQASRA